MRSRPYRSPPSRSRRPLGPARLHDVDRSTGPTQPQHHNDHLHCYNSTRSLRGIENPCIGTATHQSDALSRRPPRSAPSVASGTVTTHTGLLFVSACRLAAGGSSSTSVRPAMRSPTAGATSFAPAPTAAACVASARAAVPTRSPSPAKTNALNPTSTPTATALVTTSHAPPQRPAPLGYAASHGLSPRCSTHQDGARRGRDHQREGTRTQPDPSPPGDASGPPARHRG